MTMNLTNVGVGRSSVESPQSSIAVKTSNQSITTTSYAGVFVTGLKVVIPARVGDLIFASFGMTIFNEATDEAVYLVTMTSGDVVINQFCPTTRQANDYMQGSTAYNAGFSAVYKLLPADLIVASATNGFESTGMCVNIGVHAGSGAATGKTIIASATQKTWVTAVNLGQEGAAPVVL